MTWRTRVGLADAHPAGREIAGDQGRVFGGAVGDAKLIGAGLIIAGLAADEYIAGAGGVGIAGVSSQACVLRAGSILIARGGAQEGVFRAIVVRVSCCLTQVCAGPAGGVGVAGPPPHENVVIALVVLSGGSANKGHPTSCVVLSGAGTDKDILRALGGEHGGPPDLIQGVGVDISADIEFRRRADRTDAHVSF